MQPGGAPRHLMFKDAETDRRGNEISLVVCRKG